MSGENINRRLNIYINDREVVNSLGGVEREMAKVRGQMRNLVKGTDDYDEKLKELKDTYTQLKEKQADFREEIQDTTQVMGEAREAGAKIFSGFTSGNAKMAQEGLNGIKGSLLGVIKASWAFITTPIGATLTVLAGIGAVTKMFVDYNEQIRTSTRLIENLSGKTGEAAAEIRVGVSAIAETFKVEFDAVAKAVDNLVDTGVVKNEMEALDQIKSGLLKAPDANEFLSSLENTSETARQLGMDLEDVIALKEAIEAKGVDPEKVFGAMEKATKNLQSQTKALRDEMNTAFGAAFTDDLLKKVRTGEISINEALTRIGKKSEEVGLNMTEQQRLTSAIFGKSGIAAGGFAKILDLVTDAQDKQSESLTGLQKNLNKLAESEKALQQAQDDALRSDGYENWKTKAILAINTVKTGFWNLFYDITNGAGASADKAKADSEKKAIDNYTADALRSFEDYIARRKKSMGDEFDFEKVREERLATIRAQYAKNGGGSWDATPAQVEVQKRLEAEMTAIKNYGKEQKKQKDKQTAEEREAAEKAAEQARKDKEKALEEARKHSEDLKKELDRSQKELLDAERKFGDEFLANKKEDYEKERAQLRQEYDRKIEDIRIKIAQENEEIAKLEADKKDPANTPADVKLLEQTIANKLAMIKEYNGTVELLVSQHNIRLATLQEKYINLAFKQEQDRASRELQNLKTRQAFELAEINSLQAAKAFLADKLSAEELSKITTLEKGRTAIKKIQLQEQYDLEVKNLEKLLGQYQAFMDLDFASGFQLLSDEEREQMLKFLEEVRLKIAEIKGKGADAAASSETGKEYKANVDILGFSGDQWNEVYKNLDDFQYRLTAIQMVASVLTNAFSTYFKFLEAGENRTLANFERAAARKKAALDAQLERGQISQELYNARIKKNEEELAQKKYEIAYKQAKREKAMGIVQAVISTATAIMQAYAQLGPIGGTIAGVMLTALGALQVATIQRQPLPERDSYLDGGYTGDGNPSGISNKLGARPYDYHNGEYMVPNKVLFSSDPVVPYMIDYLEAKRTGRNPTTTPVTDNSSTTAGANAQAYTETSTKLDYTLGRILTVLEMIEQKDFIAYLNNDIPTAKKIRQKIKELERIENQASK